MRTIAITGASGFVGGSIAKYLDSRGYTVVRCGRRAGSGVDVVWDIDSGPCEGMPSVDAVIHCAARVDDWGPYDEMFRTNVQGTVNVLRTFRNSDTFIYMSSASVYDFSAADRTLKENDPISEVFLNAYSETKRLGEIEVERYTDIPKRIVLRPHIVYGPGDTTLTPRLKEAVRFGRFIVPGDGRNRLSVTHVDNLTGAVEALLDSKTRRSFEIYNLADERTGTARDIFEVFRERNGIGAPLLFFSKRISLILATMFESEYRLFHIRQAPPITRYLVAHLTGEHLLDTGKISLATGYRMVKSYLDQ